MNDAPSGPDTRFPRSVFDVGSDPDPRFSLANERTFLAWIRTALALLAAGVGLEALDLPVSAPFRIAASAVFVTLGMLAAGQAWWGWVRTERALRRHTALPAPSVGAILTVGIAAAALLLVLGYLA